MNPSPVPIEQEQLAELIRAADRFVECSTSPLLTPYIRENGRHGTKSPWVELCEAIKPAKEALDRLALSGEPVAWRWRWLYEDGAVSEWRVTDEPKASMPVEDGFHGIESKPLYLSPLSPDRGEDKGSDLVAENIRLRVALVTAAGAFERYGDTVFAAELRATLSQREG